MNYDNKHTDKKLQDLEHQSLPDLSKMDEHWQQMGLLLQPGTASLSTRKTIFRKKLVLVTTAIAVIAIVSFFIYQQVNHKKGFRESNTVVNNTISTIDSPVLLKARTGEGKDTTFEATAVTETPKSVNSKLLLEKFYEQLQKKPQRFIINNKRDTVINGKEGTQLFIPANSFDTKDNFTLLLTEFYSVADMITHKLTTTCDAQQLVTGGMIYLDARDNNDNMVDLTPSASLRVDMPKREGQGTMRLFYGTDYYRNDVTMVLDSIRWGATNQLFATARPKQYPVFKMNKETETVDVTGYISENKKDTIGWKTFNRDTLISESDRFVRAYDTNRKTDSLLKVTGIDKDSLMVKRFGVNINRLGWINCDRFYNDTRPKEELIVDLNDNPLNYNTFLVFDNMASIIPPSMMEGDWLESKRIRFMNIPQGESVRVISVGVKDGKTVTAMQPLVVSKNSVVNLNFEEVSPSDFKKKLN